MLTAHRGKPPTFSTRQGAVVCTEFDSTAVGLFVGWHACGSPWVAWQRPGDSKRDISARFDSMCKRLKRQHENRNARKNR